MNSIFAQCDAFGYQIQTTGFACETGNPGTICIITDYDWLTGSNCIDYVYEIEYPTGAFIYTNLGEFALHSQTTQTTILRCTPLIFSDGTTYSCLDGLIQVPNTIFTFRLVNVNDPNDVLSTTTFLLDDAKVIGAAGQQTLLSTAIANGDLLPQAQAQTQGQNIVINGELIVDEDYYFGSTNAGGLKNSIAMGPKAKITVKSGVKLVLQGADVFPCDNQWDRIEVDGTLTLFQANVRGADVAVELKDQSTLNVYAATVIKDSNIGIGSFGANQKSISLNFYASLFVKNRIENCIDGMHFESTNTLTVDRPLSISSCSSNGIYLDKTGFIGSRLYIASCFVGINAVTPSPILDIMDSGIETGYIGINTVGNDYFNVQKNFIFGFELVGINRLMNIANQTTKIISNVIAGCNYGIYGSVLSSSAEIQSNDIRSNVTNVWMEGGDSGSHKWAVQHNDDMNAGYVNVISSNMNNARIFRNTGMFSEGYCNNYVIGGKQAVVGYNTETAPENNNVIYGNPKGLNYCNTLEAGTCTMFLDDCAGTDFKGNTMTGKGHNLAYGLPSNTFAVTGPQDYKGNVFDPSGEITRKAIHYGSAQEAQISEFKIGFISSSQGDQYYPFFDSQYPNWFVKKGGSDYICQKGLINPDDKDVRVRLKAAIETDIEIIKAGVADIYGESILFTTQLRLLRSMEELNILEGLDAAFLGEYENLKNSSVGKFVAFEQQLANHFALNGGENAQIEQLQNSIESINKQASSIVDISVDKKTQKIKVDASLQSQKQDLSKKSAAQTNALSQIVNAKNDGIDELLSQLNKINESVEDNNITPAFNLKIANRLLLKYYAPDFKAFNQSEKSEIASIAYQCYGYGGDGVLIARYLQHKDGLTPYDYKDECVRSSQSRSSKVIANYRIADKIVAFPNPTDSYMSVLLPSRKESTTLTLTDLFGKVIKKYAIAAEQKDLGIETAELMPGVYLLHRSDLANETLRIIIARF